MRNERDILQADLTGGPWTITNINTDVSLSCNEVTGNADIAYGDALGNIVRQLEELKIFKGSSIS